MDHPRDRNDLHYNAGNGSGLRPELSGLPAGLCTLGHYLDCSYTSVAQCSQTVALSPLLEPRLQIEISQGMSRTPSALGASRSHKAPVAVIGGSRRNSRKIIGEITRGLRAERSDRTPGVIGGIQINYGSRPLVCTGLLYARLMLAFRWILFRQSEGRDDDVFSTLRIDVGSR